MRIGVVLGGGGARGFAHLGVLQELQRQRVPIACIAGTSAGALIGGAYASGQNLEQLQRQLAAADWDLLLSGKPRRQDMPYQHKHSDARNYFDLMFGFRDGSWRLPPAAINAQQIDLFIRQLTQARNEASFDALSIPFRAVATDLESGEAVVFDGGDLSLALRASMAVPGMFAPVEAQGRVLVDGGLARQLPVEELLGRCADVLIVVDVGTPPVPREQLKSFLDVLDQTSYLMVARNSRESLARLRSQDVVIRPQLEGVSPADFADNARIVEAGRLAARALEPVLRPLAVSEPRYRQWLAARAPAPRPRVDDVTVNSELAFVSPEGLQQRLSIDTRQNLGAFHQRLNEVFAEGDLEQLDYSLQQTAGRTVAQVQVREKNIGPNYVRGGLELRGDTQGEATFSLLGEYRRSWLNTAGGSLHGEIKLGDEPGIRGEWFQPFADSSPAFAALSAAYREKLYALYVYERQPVLELRRTTRTLNADFGWRLGGIGELRAGYYRSHDAVERHIAPTEVTLEGNNWREQGARVLLAVDQLDNRRWPRHGYAASLELQRPYEKGEVSPLRARLLLDGAVTDRHDISWRGTLRGGFGDRRDGDEVFELGGFRNLSGYRSGELLGRSMLFLRGMVSWRVASLPSALGSGLYVGASAELGQAWAMLPTDRNSGWLPAGSLFVGADTLLGPLFLGVGYGKRGELTGYLNLGVEY